MGFLIYQVMFEIVVSLEDLFRLSVRKGYWVPQSRHGVVCRLVL